MRINNLIRVDEKKIRDMGVREKFGSTFRQIITMFVVAVVILAFTILTAIMSIRTIYNKYYTMNTIQPEIRVDMQALSKAFLWALSSPDEALRQEQLDKAMEKFGEFEANLSKLSKVSNDSSAISVVSKDLETVEANGKTLGEMFKNGSSSEDIF